MNRRIAATVGVLAVVGAVAIGFQHELPWGHSRHPDFPTRPDDPPWVPVVGQADADLPPPLLPTPGPNRISEAARFAHTRAAGERFALLVAQLYSDARRSDPSPAALDAFLSPRMPEGIRRFLLSDVRAQRQLGTERHIDTTLEIWIRSQAVGTTAAPDRVNVEFASSSVSRPLGIQGWYRDRYDVVWESGRWQLISYSAGLFGPDTIHNLSTGEQKAFLTGPGWRRIPAGSG